QMLKMKYMIVGFITVFTLNTSLLAKASENGDPARGREVFAAKCTPCHGQTGHGDGPGAASLQPKPRNLSDTYISALNDDLLFKAISEGGAAMGKSPAMPSWKFALSEDDIWNVIAYIKQDICKCEHKEEVKENK
ncbi:MAG: c-type cytochrome, partial [Ignavibacteriales bacterium]